MSICNAVLLLAQLAFHEARGEDLKGQLAVMQVAMNRLDYDTETVCDVVKEDKQFAHGSIPDDAEQHTTALLFLQGELQSPVWSRDKTHFYSGSKPYWAKESECQTYEKHVFCRVE